MSSLNDVDLEGSVLENADLSGATLNNIRGWEKVGSFKALKVSGASGLRYEDWEFSKVRGTVGEPVLSPDEVARRNRDKNKIRDNFEKSKNRQSNPRMGGAKR